MEDLKNLNQKSERIDSLDVAKGGMIIGVVYAHFITDASINVVYYSLYFCLIFFFALSTYYYKPGRGVWFNIKKRARQLLVPLFCYTAVVIGVFYLYLSLRGQTPGVDETKDYIIRTLLGPNSFEPLINTELDETPYGNIALAFWFLQTMFLANVIFYTMADWALEKLSRVLALAGLLILATCFIIALNPTHLFWMAQIAPALAGMMLVSAYCGKRDVLSYIQRGYRTVVYWVIFVGLFAVYGLLLVFFPMGMLVEGDFGEYFYSAFTTICGTLLGGYVVISFCLFLDRIKPVASVLKKLGRCSLTVLMLHMLYGTVISDLLGWDGGLATVGNTRTQNFGCNSPFQWQQYVLLVVVLMLCYLTDKLIRGIGEKSR